MRTASRRTAFATMALTAAFALWTSGAPSVVYPVYGRVWQVPHALTTLVFAAFPLALLVVLGLFGGISDRIGRRAAILLGLALMAAGTLAFALAPSVPVLLLGRVLTGAGVGFALSPATAGLGEYAKPGRAHVAGTVATVATAAGLAVALLVGGAFLTWIGDPLHASYWPLLGAILLTLLLALRLASTGRGEGRLVQVLRVPRSMRGVVVQGALGVATAYSIGAVVLALGADVAVGLIGTGDPLVIGALLAVSAVTIGFTALVARRLRASSAAPAGAVAMVVGAGVLVLAGAAGSLVLFLVAIVLTGAGYSLLFAAGIGVAGALAPPEHRAATISTVYFFGYAVQAVVAIGLGQLSTSVGLLPAIETAAVLVSVLAIAAGTAPLVRARRARRVEVAEWTGSEATGR